MNQNQNISSGDSQRYWFLERKYFVLVAGWVGINLSLYWNYSSGEPRGFSQREIAQLLEKYETREIQVSGDQSESPVKIRYQMMEPKSVISDQKYPLVLFLHGAGGKGSDGYRHLKSLPRQMADSEWRERFPCFLVAPQCPSGQSWAHQMENLEAILEEAFESLPVDRNRVYLTGLSMGGFGSWELAARRPELFAAVVPICGGGDLSTAERLVGVPISVVHGDADESVPVEQSRRMVEAIRKEGGNPIYTELKGVEHNSWTPAYRDPHGVIEWMFQQVKHP